MTVQFPPELQDYVRATVARGDYSSEQELVVSAVAILKELKAKHEQLRRDIQLGIEQCNRGESAPLDIEKIKHEARRRFEANRNGEEK